MLRLSYWLFKYVYWWRRFRYQDQASPYFCHPYNATWRNERAVEVPIIWKETQVARTLNQNILEIGNVLSHYFPTDHQVLDKYEQAPGVHNSDVLEYQPSTTYDLIVSISTLEHIGWDEAPRDPLKTLKTLQHIQSWLTPDTGKAILTFPLGYNPCLDWLLAHHKLPFKQIRVLQRISADNRWQKAPLSLIYQQHTYGQPFANANVIVIGELCR